MMKEELPLRRRGYWSGCYQISRSRALSVFQSSFDCFTASGQRGVSATRNQAKSPARRSIDEKVTEEFSVSIE